MKLQLLAFWLSVQQNCLPLLSSKHPHRPRQWAPGVQSLGSCPLSNHSERVGSLKTLGSHSCWLVLQRGW